MSFVNASDVAEVFELPADGVETNNDDLNDVEVDEPEQTADEFNDEQTNGDGGELNGPVLLSDDSVQGFFSHTSSVYCVAIYPGENKLACTGDGDNKSFIWDYSTGATLQELKSHEDSVSAVQFSSGGLYLATAGMDGIIHIYERNNESKQGEWKFLHRLEGPAQEIEWLAWHPVADSAFLACGSADSTVSLFNAKSGSMINAFSGHSGSCSTGGFTADGKLLVSAGEDGSLFIWSPKTGAAKTHLKKHHLQPITAMQLQKNKTSSNLIATGDIEGIIKILNYESGKVLWTLRGHTDSIESLDFSPDYQSSNTSKFIASASSDGNAKVWDLNSGQCRITIAHDESVTIVRFHPTQPILFSSSVDHSIKASDPRSGALVFKFLGHTEAILAMEISPTGERFITASDDQTALVFDTSHNQQTLNAQKEKANEKHNENKSKENEMQK